MIFKSIRISKFRQFKDETTVTFSTDKEKNVTIILGDNTFGKTTLLQAFNWCLYGEADFDNNPKFLLNLDYSSEMEDCSETEVEVEIHLFHNNYEYTILRTQKYKKISAQTSFQPPQLSVSYKDGDGKTNLINDYSKQEVINSILPKDLSTYFFFDTERVRNISERKDIAKSVKDILGLSIIDNAINHLGTEGNKKSVIGEFYNLIDTDGNEIAEKERRKMEHYTTENINLKVELTKTKTEIQEYEIKKEKIENILRANKNTSEIQNKIDELRDSITIQKLELNKMKKSFIKKFSSELATNYMSYNLLTNAFLILSSSNAAEKGIRDLNANVINALLKQKKCLCGCELHEGGQAYEMVKDHLKYIPPESIGTKINVYKTEVKGKNSNRDDFFIALVENYKSIVKINNQISILEDELTSSEKELSGKEDMKTYEEELSTCKERLEELNKKKDEILLKQGEATTNYKKAKENFDSQQSNSDKNKELSIYLEYASIIKEWLDKTYKEKEILVREALEEKVNIIFNKMYHGKRRVLIDDKYRVSLLSTIGDEEIDTGESEGSNRVKSFAFISGIVSLAREKIVSTSEIDISTEPYPLVMDAPFSNADEKHTKNISKILPEIAEQVIMFVMEKDWKYASEVIDNKVGMRYLLDKKSEIHTVIKEI
ncbi:MAG: AAA family ATPase [Malacoplasma sp.]